MYTPFATAAQSGYDPRFGKADRCLCRALVPRLADARRYNCGAVMLGQFLVTAVQNHIVPGVGQRGRFAVVRDQQPCDAAEVVECMDMAVQPVLGFHVVAGFRIGKAAAERPQTDMLWIPHR